MLSDAPLSTVPMSSSLVALVVPDAYRAWDDSEPEFEVLDQSEGLPDGQ
jgi:hypothetical protein